MEPINVREYEAAARAKMDPIAWDYYAGGSDDQVTLRANGSAFERIRLRPRVLVDVSRCDTATTVLGTPVRCPVLIAPTGYHMLAHPEGECATARGAGEAGTLMAVSTMSTRRLEEIAAAASGPLWFQLYVYADRAVSAALVRRAEAAGYRALVLTVDAVRLGNREADERNHFTLPPGLRMANFEDVGLERMRESETGSGLVAHSSAVFDTALSWEALDWLRSISRLPVIVKGIMTGEDAALAADHGVAGIIVSNHGGRQLDSVAPTIEVLPEVVTAVADRCEVYLDGGVRRGTDVLKALALGARAVLIGRPALWGLAADGAAGVARVLELLRTELERDMALAGRPTIASIDAALVTPPGR